MAQTIQTIFCVDTKSTAIPTIKVATCIVGFIITKAIGNQIKWSCTVQIFVTYTFRAPICVHIRSTTIPTIIITLYIVKHIRADAIANMVWSPTIRCFTTFVIMKCLVVSVSIGMPQGTPRTLFSKAPIPRHTLRFQEYFNHIQIFFGRMRTLFFQFLCK